MVAYVANSRYLQSFPALIKNECKADRIISNTYGENEE